MLKRLLLLFISSILVFSCTKESISTPDIVAVDFPSYDAARAILSNDDRLVMLLPPGAESHHYEPTPKDMITLSNASLIIYAGGDSDSWVDSIIASLDNDIATFKLIDQVPLFNEELKEGMTDDGHDHEHEEIDEHVWTSPVNEIKIIENLCNVLTGMYSDEKDMLISNANAYIEQLKDIDSEIRQIVKTSKYKTLVFASRFPLRYFTQEYGLDYYAAFPGCAEETEPSASTVAFLIDKIKELHLGYVLDIEFGSPLIADVIASEAGVEVRRFNSMHNISADDFAKGKDYISIMKENIEVLTEVLN